MSNATPPPLPLRAGRSGRSGFTLVELLIVIAILLFLLALVAMAVTGLFTKAQATRSAQALNVTLDALERFREEFPIRNLPGGPERGFPIKSNWNDISQDIADMTDGEWLRLLLFPSEDEIETILKPVGVTSRVSDRNVIERFLNDSDINIFLDNGNTRPIPAYGAIVDGWSRPIYYRFPGMSHILEVNYRKMAGTNNLMLGRPDLWSAGEDGESAYGIYGGLEPGQEITMHWTKENNPFKTADPEFIDDIANWFAVDNY